MKMSAVFVFAVLQCVIGGISMILGIVDRIQAPDVAWDVSYLLLPFTNGILILLSGALGIVLSLRRLPTFHITLTNICTGLSITCSVATSILITVYIGAMSDSHVFSGADMRYHAIDGLDKNPPSVSEKIQLHLSAEEKQHATIAILLYVLAMLELVVSLCLAINCLSIQWRCHGDFVMGAEDLQSVLHGSNDDPPTVGHMVLQSPRRGGTPATASYAPLTESPVQSRHHTREAAHAPSMSSAGQGESMLQYPNVEHVASNRDHV